MIGFPDMIRSLEYYGISDVLLPFIIIFTIVFAVMQKTKLLGEGRKNYNVIIALAMALGVIIPHVLGRYPSRESDIVLIMNQALPQVSIILVAILMMLIIMGVFGANIRLAGTTMGGWFTLIAIIAIVIIFGNAAGWFYTPWFYWLTVNSDLRNLVVIILVFGIIIAFITKEDSESKKAGFFQNIGDEFSKIIHGGNGGGHH
jgi:hypothetical protein